MIQAKVKRTFQTALQFDVETGAAIIFLWTTRWGKRARSPLS